MRHSLSGGDGELAAHAIVVIESGVHVVMTVQTLWGYAQMYVYDTGRDLLDIGVVPLDNMLPETALMKLCWVLGHTDDHQEVLEMMRERKIPVVVGADAHVPQRVGDGFREALELLKQCGYRHVSYFLERTRRELAIDDALASLAANPE